MASKESNIWRTSCSSSTRRQVTFGSISSRIQRPPAWHRWLWSKKDKTRLLQRGSEDTFDSCSNWCKMMQISITRTTNSFQNDSCQARFRFNFKQRECVGPPNLSWIASKHSWNGHTTQRTKTFQCAYFQIRTALLCMSQQLTSCIHSSPQRLYSSKCLSCPAFRVPCHSCNNYQYPPVPSSTPFLFGQRLLTNSLGKPWRETPTRFTDFTVFPQAKSDAKWPIPCCVLSGLME